MHGVMASNVAAENFWDQQLGISVIRVLPASEGIPSEETDESLLTWHCRRDQSYDYWATSWRRISVGFLAFSLYG